MTNPFRFKQFIVHHDRCAMKVGTDAVLLGAWADVDDAKSILDIGTGSGILALMTAQRTPPGTKVDAVEIGHADFLQASQNILLSPWPDKIKMHFAAIQDYALDKAYDLIICNPPYFVNSLLPPGTARRQARHEGSLSHRDLLAVAKNGLSPSGKLAVIFPTVEGHGFRSAAKEFGLFCSRRLAFYSRKEKPQERWLMEFSFKEQNPVTETLVLYGEKNDYTEAYKALTRDFYIIS